MARKFGVLRYVQVASFDTCSMHGTNTSKPWIFLGWRHRPVCLRRDLTAIQGSHGESFRLQLLVVELSLLKRATPYLGRSLTINAMGQTPGLVFIHAGNNLSKTIHNMLERVDVVVENDDFGFRIALCGFLPLQKRRR